MKLAIILFFGLGGLNSQAADFSTLLGASAKQAVTSADEMPDFPMPETPAVPQHPLPFLPPSDPHPFFIGYCMAFCPWGFDNRPGASPCTCYDPFAESGVGCRLDCEAGRTPEPPCDCGPLYWANTARGTSPAKAAGKSLASFLDASSTATVTCGGVEYSIFAFPMNCGMETAPAEWLETGAAYYAYGAARARQPLLKKQVLEHFNGVRNDAAAAAVAERSSRIFSDGAVLFIASEGKVAEVADRTAARNVYEGIFPFTASKKAGRDLGVHKAVVRGVLACMASDACWNGATGIKIAP